MISIVLGVFQDWLRDCLKFMPFEISHGKVPTSCKICRVWALALLWAPEGDNLARWLELEVKVPAALAVNAKHAPRVVHWRGDDAWGGAVRARYSFVLDGCLPIRQRLVLEDVV